MRLSIIIPVFGVEGYISRCLDSVYSINLPENDFEVICVDDCSTDSSATIVEGYKNKHSNLVLLRHDRNKRQGGARNTGISHAKGDYIIFVDADDIIPNYDVSGILDYMVDNNLELFLGSAEIHKKNGSVLRWGNSPLEESEIMKGPEIYIKEYVHKIAFGVVWMGIYKTGLVKRIGPFLENVQYEDSDWTLRCAYEAKLLQYRPVVIYHYMENEGSTTKVGSVQKLIDRVKQGLRVWKWAQTTSTCHDDVMVAAEDYCTWNLQCLSSLRYYRHSDRVLFYQSFSEEEMSTMRQWRMGGKWMNIIKSPAKAETKYFFLSPVYRFGRYIKNIIKSK